VKYTKPNLLLFKLQISNICHHGSGAVNTEKDCTQGTGINMDDAQCIDGGVAGSTCNTLGTTAGGGGCDGMGLTAGGSCTTGDNHSSDWPDCNAGPSFYNCVGGTSAAS